MKRLIVTLYIIYSFTLVGMEEPPNDVKVSIRTQLAQNVRICSCGEKFTTFENIEEHIEQTHKSGNVYSCTKCTLRYGNFIEFLLHLPKCTKEVIYHCKQCDFSNSIYTSIARHLVLHKDYYRAFEYLSNFGFCKKNNQRFYTCPTPTCEEQFRQLKSFLDHIHYTHLESGYNLENSSPIPKPLVSQNATIQTQYEPNFAQSEGSAITNDGKYKCPVEDYTFNCESKYNKHLELHTKYPLEFNYLIQQQALKINPGEKFECPKCKKKVCLFSPLCHSYKRTSFIRIKRINTISYRKHNYFRPKQTIFFTAPN